MGFDFASRTVVLALRVAQAVLAIIILGLSAYVAKWWSGYWHASSPSQVSYLIFCAVWTLLALIFLILVPWRFSDSMHHSKFGNMGGALIFVVEMVTMIFWFAGFIALAVFLSDRVCFGNVCSAAKAAAVFAAFEWLVFAMSAALSVLHVMRSRGRGDRGKPDPNANVVHQGV